MDVADYAIMRILHKLYLLLLELQALKAIAHQCDLLILRARVTLQVHKPRHTHYRTSALESTQQRNNAHTPLDKKNACEVSAKCQ